MLTHDGRAWDGSIVQRLGRIVDKIEEVKRSQAKFGGTDTTTVI